MPAASRRLGSVPHKLLLVRNVVEINASANQFFDAFRTASVAYSIHLVSPLDNQPLRSNVTSKEYHSKGTLIRPKPSEVCTFLFSVAVASVSDCAFTCACDSCPNARGNCI
jgi:hypothetical protein